MRRGPGPRSAPVHQNAGPEVRESIAETVLVTPWNARLRVDSGDPLRSQSRRQPMIYCLNSVSWTGGDARKKNPLRPMLRGYFHASRGLPEMEEQS